MFTGIITCIGKAIRNNETLIVYVNDIFLLGLKIGDSVCVNGICLTVVKFNENSMEFFVMSETLKVTSIDSSYVNLERALVYGHNISGHIISGHVNNIGTIENIINNKDSSKTFVIRIKNKMIVKYKDSVAINGTSLTVAKFYDDIIEVCLIPYTINNTTFQYSAISDKVNIEYDISPVHEIDYMAHAIELSEKGRQTTLPNPWVGCVIVNHNVVIGEGYHQKCGRNHAEKEAIDDAIAKGNTDLIKGSTAYVTLEPCHHYGRTPPCDKLFVDYGISKVVIGHVDPDHRTNNSGIDFLRGHGIVVEFSHTDAVYNSLKSYIHSRKFELPYCILKTAISLDGHIATETGDSKWISNEKSRSSVHKLRSESHAIIVGSNTVLKDNPMLNVRQFNKTKIQPLRIILDTYNKITNPTLNIFDISIAPTLIFTSELPSIQIPGISYQVVSIVDGKLDLLKIMQCIHKLGIMQCLVEGGSGLYTSFIEAGLAQEVYMYRSNINLGCAALPWVMYKGADKIENNNRWDLLEVTQFDNDILCRYRIPSINVCPLRNTINDAINALQQGNPIIIMDSPDRENEGDIIFAAEKIDAEKIAFMMRNTTGIICVAMTKDRADYLHLDSMVQNNQDPNQTNFTISCDYNKSKTGISASERAKTIQILAGDDSVSNDLTRPGHVFPLVAHPGGLLSRKGHTESSVYVCGLAGLKPIAAIAELVCVDGSVMRYNNCVRFAKMYDIPLITMDIILNHIATTKPSITVESSIATKSPIMPPEKFKFEQIVRTIIMTKEYGEWMLAIYSDKNTNIKNNHFSAMHRVMIKNPHLLSSISPTCVRIHSDCYTGDVLGSTLCDCGDQLDLSFKMINERQTGIIIFPAYHEGRGIGLIDKLSAYNLIRETKCSTFEANKILGYPDDIRSYEIVPLILDHFNIKKIELLTNNKIKVEKLEKYIVKVTPLLVKYNDYNIDYIKTKTECYGYVKNITNNYSIAIITTEWHHNLINPFLETIKNIFNSHNIYSIKEYVVPGAFEIPFMAKQIITKTKCDAVLCIGLVLKGETAHFEYISNATINGLMTVQLETGVPIINGVLNCYTIDQAKNRFDPHGELAISLANTLISMIELKNTI